MRHAGTYRWTVLVLALTAAVTGFACQVGEEAHEEMAAEGHPAQEESHGEEEVHWGYEGDTGPENWGSLSERFATCDTGLEQSPIDISPADAEPGSFAVSFDYRPSALKVFNNGHTIEAVYDSGSSIDLGTGAPFELLQFHFHGPSENTVNGAHTPMEVHLVHRDPSGALAVIGVLIDEGAEHAATSELWANAPEEAGQTNEVPGATIDAAALLPAGRSAYRFPGSLTTPGCDEGVTWTVMAEAIEMSAEQIGTLARLIGPNNRPVQPLNDRVVLSAEL